MTYLLNKNKGCSHKKIHGLTNNIVERFRVSLIGQSFYNWMYENNPLNANFDDLHFDGDQRWIIR